MGDITCTCVSPSWMKYNNKNIIPVDRFLADALLELDMGYLNCRKSSFSWQIALQQLKQLLPRCNYVEKQLNKVR